MHLLTSSPSFLSAVFSSPQEWLISSMKNIQVQSSKKKLQIWILSSFLQQPSVWTLSACDSGVWMDTFEWCQCHNGTFFLKSTKAPAVRERYIYSRHAKHALCRLERSCQCLLYFQFYPEVFLQRPCMAMFPALVCLAVVLLVVVVVVALGTT